MQVHIIHPILSDLMEGLIQKHSAFNDDTDDDYDFVTGGPCNENVHWKDGRTRFVVVSGNPWSLVVEFNIANPTTVRVVFDVLDDSLRESAPLHDSMRTFGSMDEWNRYLSSELEDLVIRVLEWGDVVDNGILRD